VQADSFRSHAKHLQEAAHCIVAGGEKAQSKEKTRLSSQGRFTDLLGQPLFLFLTIWLFIPFSKQEFLLISEFYPFSRLLLIQN
jgi:hypothetical protein